MNLSRVALAATSTVIAVATVGVCADVIEAPELDFFASPGPSQWKPPADIVAEAGARPSILGPRTGYRTLHSDTVNSDEVDIAFSPMFEHAWTAEPNLYLPEGPTFDGAGNLYITPLMPPENVWLLSLDHRTGARRFVIEGTPDGAGGSPLVLDDPDHPGDQVIYAGSYSEFIAVRANGDVVWRSATGLPDLQLDRCDFANEDEEEDFLRRMAEAHVYGLNYHPQTDTIVGITGGGHLVFFDRQTGVKRGGFVARGASAQSNLPFFPEFLWDRFGEQLAPFLSAPCGVNPARFLLSALLGGGAKIANYFSIDPVRGRIWLAGTDPVDSTRGALYRIEVRESQGELVITDGDDGAPCFSMSGSSASTPTVRSDGMRVYIADNNPDPGFSEYASNIYAINAATCEKQAETGVDSPIIASLAVSLDGEIYATTLTELIKLQDEGNSFGSTTPIPLTAAYDAKIGQVVTPMLPPAIAQNGLAVELGAGYPIGGQRNAILTTSVALIDRETGAIRYAAAGGEESVATTSVGPDGSLYLGHSPVRRVAAAVLFPRAMVGELTGGVAKWRAIRKDLLTRDAACAAADRVEHLHDHESEAGAGFRARSLQVADALLRQAARAADEARTEGDLGRSVHAMVSASLSQAQAALAAEQLTRAELTARLVCTVL